MIQILGIKVWEEISYGIVKFLYGTIMRIYEFVLELIDSSSTIDAMNFASFASNIYVLAGVFMLFRVVISMIQMIINPDQVTDKQAGAQKLIMRIVVSIIMLIAFSPDGILFRKSATLEDSGLFPRIEHALLAEDSIINNLIKITPVEEESTSTIPHLNYRTSISKYIFEDVYAEVNDETGVTTCWFYKDLEETVSSAKTGTKKTYVNKKVYKVQFSDEKLDSGYILVRNRSDDKKLYAKFITEPDGAIDSNGKTVYQNYGAGPSKIYQARTDTLLGDQTQVRNCQNWYLNDNYYGDTNSFTLKHSTSNVIGRWKGYNSFQKLLNAMKSDLKSTGGKEITGEELSETQKGIKNTVFGTYDDNAIAFANSLLSSFQECVTDINENSSNDCELAKKQQFDSSDNSEIVNLMDQNKLKFDFFTALLVGIGVIIYLVILAVDVVVRGFKLALLQLLAPIPIISYVDPKDKIFNQWIKMYMSTFLELFIKLLAISIAVNLLTMISSAELFDTALKTLVAIIAVLVFAKLFPSIISKIFGIDSMGGSFKDIMGMGKTALGFGAGAALGAAAGAATGQGLGRLSGFAKGALMGAGSGSKGKIFGGAQGVSARNAKINQQKANGLNMFDRMIVGMAGATGITPGAKAETQMDRAASAYDAQSKYKKYLLDQVKKKNAVFDVGAINGGRDIMSKDKTRVVARTNEDSINMKDEYAKQSNLSNLTQDQWNKMSDVDRATAFGEAAFNEDGSRRSLTEAQIFQNDRVAALEDFAAGAMANKLEGDAENIKEYNTMVDAVSKAQGAGVAIDDVPKLGEFNNKTISNVKDQALAGYNKAASDPSLKIKKNLQNK